MSEGETRLVILKEERPKSWNEYYAGSHWSKRNAHSKATHLIMREALDPDDPPFQGPVDITITSYCKGRSMDADNVTTKLYIDGLKGFWLDDDSPLYVHSVTSKVARDDNDPRVEVRAVQCGPDFEFTCNCCDKRYPTMKMKLDHEKTWMQDDED